MTEPSQCPLCDGGGLVPETARYLCCPACGTLTQVTGEASVLSDPVDYARGQNPADHRWLSLLSTLTEGRRLFDVGCGSGAFVEVASAAGWQATGFDSDRRLIGLAGHLGDKVEALDAQHWNPVDDSYDVVRLWFVLEHVQFPGRLLRRAIGALRSNGLLQVAVPNDAGWLSRRVMASPDDRFWEHPLHLHHFAPFGLERWLEAQGCEHEVLEAGRPTELMRGGSLPLDETWEAVRRIDPSLSRLFYQLGVGRSREMIWRKAGTQGA